MRACSILDHVLLPFRKDGRAGKVKSDIAISSVLRLDVVLLQNEKAYQKQRLTFQNSKAVLIGGSKKKKDLRFVRNVGLGFKTPREVSKESD